MLGDLTLQINYAVGRLVAVIVYCFSGDFKSIGYDSLLKSVMGCSLIVTGAGMIGWECER